MDTLVWLRQHDLTHLRADGYGTWLEKGRSLRFLVHLDPGPIGEVIAEHAKHTYGLDAVLAGYRAADPAVPFAAVLIAENAEREKQMLSRLIRRPLRASIATTGKDRRHRYWPNEQVWRVPGEDEARRLIDLAP